MSVQGSGDSGRLGTGSNASSATPAEVAGGHSFVSVAAGQAHACALTPEGQAWCCELEGAKVLTNLPQVVGIVVRAVQELYNLR